MAFNYLQIVGDCFPTAEAVVSGTDNPETYSNLVWITTPISQTDLENSTCANLTDTVNYIGTPSVDDLLVWDGSTWTLQTNASALMQAQFANKATTKNRWLDYTHDKSSDEVPYVVPWNAKLVGITFANENNGAGTDIEIHRASNTQGSNGVNIHTLTITSARVAQQTTFSPEVLLTAGDKIGVYLKKNGTNPKGPIITLYFKQTDNINLNLSESYSGDF